MRVSIPVRTYSTAHRTCGDIPEWLQEKLPLFGTEAGETTYLSSGGRSLLIEENGQTYRIKGADPKGVITKTVAVSGKNIVRDTEQSAAQVPDAESDLRLEEFEMQFRRHLQHASPEELQEIKDDVLKLYEALCRWHAFECSVLAGAGLVLSPDSFLGQNYVLAHIRPGEVGISRVK